jgi:hypothetical protein
MFAAVWWRAAGELRPIERDTHHAGSLKDPARLLFMTMRMLASSAQGTDMNTKPDETTALSDAALDAVSGGIKNDPLTTHTKLVEYGDQIAATKALGAVAEFYVPQ